MTFTGTYQAVIFDFDGTLADSHAAMVRCYTRFAEEFGADLSTLDQYLGMPSGATAMALVPDESRWEEAVQRIEDLECTDTAGVVALPGSLRALESVGDRAAIGTSCTERLLVARMGAAGLPLPRTHVTRDMVEHGKPDPESFLLAAEKLGVAPETVLVFEDAPAGIEAARAAGMGVVGVLSTKTAAELGADAHVQNLDAVQWDVTDGEIRVLVVE